MQWKAHLSDKVKAKLPESDGYINKENLHRYFQFGYERNKIWERRFVNEESYPWTDDEILRDINFCNTYRILDRNSQWEVKNITLLKRDLKLKDYVWRVIFYRYFNSPDFFEFLRKETNWLRGIPKPKQYDKDLFLDLMSKARENKVNPFTTAYLTNSVACPGKTRDWCFSQTVIPNLINKLDEIVEMVKTGHDPKSFIDWCASNLVSASKFLSHEFYVSLNFAYHIGNPLKWGNGHDLYANIGPGASCGLRMIFPNCKNSKEQYKAMKYLRAVAPKYIKKHFPDFTYTKWDGEKFVKSEEFNLTLLTFEHWLCEYSKLWRIREDLGGKRKKYIPKKNKKKEYFFLY